MGYQVIARKWRPQTFAEVIGQEHVTRTLSNAIQQNRVAHAYIFSGARGVGKTSTARILAKALNCEKGPTVTPCGTCTACTEITAGNSLDVMEIDAASNRGIDEVRELREMVRYAPLSRRNRIVILDEAHMLTSEASNALLKTLEEPPPGVVFVLATTEPEKLSDTIRSRAQHFFFRALTFQEITDAMSRIAAQEKLAIEPGAMAVMARAAEGSVRDGLSLLEQAIAYCGDKISDAQVRELLGVVAEESLDEFIAAIHARSAERALALVHRLLADGHNLQHFCREAIRHVRNLLVAKVNGAESPLIAAPPDERPRLQQQAALFSEEDLTRIFQVLLHADDDLRRKPDPRLHLEMAMLRLVNAARLAPLEEVLAELGSPRPAATHVPAPALRGGASASAASAVDSARRNAGPASPPVTPSSAKMTFAAPAPARLAAPPEMPADAATLAGEDDAMPAEDAALEEAAGLVAMAPPSAVAQTASAGNGLTLAQQEEIKRAIAQQSSMLSGLLEPISRWELDGSELRVYYPNEKRALADILQAREQMEKLRTISSGVLGQSLRVCVRLDAAAQTAPVARKSTQATMEARRMAEQDPVVREMLARFGGNVSQVRRRDEE